MCRKSKFCVLLGEDTSKWNKYVLLPSPVWFDEQALLFRHAVEKAATGEKAQAIRILRGMRSDEMREWFVEHGQMSGWHRFKRLGIPGPTASENPLDEIRSPAGAEQFVFERDSYTCRYCGLQQVAKRVLAAFEKVVGTAEFRTQGSNADQHGVVHAFKIVADHVEHYKCGGRTHADNLVTSCPGCNYGKYYYTLQQLGLVDPRARPPIRSDWDGLTSFLPGLIQNQMPHPPKHSFSPRLQS